MGIASAGRASPSRSNTPHHRNSEGACGFLLETRYGNIYHPGDGRFDHPHKAENCGLKVDYLLLPINDTNLGVGFAALLTRILQPKVVIPCHYGFTSPPVRSQGGHPAEFVTAPGGRETTGCRPPTSRSSSREGRSSWSEPGGTPPPGLDQPEVAAGMPQAYPCDGL